jgi:hypothetical protein
VSIFHKETGNQRSLFGSIRVALFPATSLVLINILNCYAKEFLVPFQSLEVGG